MTHAHKDKDKDMESGLKALSLKINGELYYNASPEHQVQLLAYSTDASVYQEKPLAVALPENTTDIRLLIDFAAVHHVTLIPRAAGTSLAGQVVGAGIIVDSSRYFNKIISVHPGEKWVIVQPGVIRDDLNHFLRPYGLMFGPETSTASRAMIGGMVGNNSCGLHSIVWGAVRDHLLEATVILSDGSEAVFKEESIDVLSQSVFKNKIYKDILQLLSDQTHQQLITHNFPKPGVVRRNTGYALDSLIGMQPFSPAGKPFNLCKLIAGSEGTLAFITEVKLQLIDLPPGETALVCVHCTSIEQALQANIIALQHTPAASELVDRYILHFTYAHPEYSNNCFFIEGDPAAILMVEFMAHSKEQVTKLSAMLIQDLEQQGFGYAFPVLYNQETAHAWNVRKAGLGLLRNLPGDVQPVNLIEDCAVSPGDLYEYVTEVQSILARHKINASYYAHAGAGELHIEPMINLRTAAGLSTFRNILAETVDVVKKYRGSLSGEHGDGRLRGEYISSVVGAETYELFRKIKQLFDPHAIFNKGKITDTPAMDAHLRIKVGEAPPAVKTTLNFTNEGGIRALAEKCSGSGDCRKTELSGGTMCPSYMATRNEKDTTRARANLLRQFLSNSSDKEPFDHEEIKEVMDLCISCKGCKTECPSGVDVTKMKAEFQQQYYEKHRVPFRAKLIGNFAGQMKLASKVRWLYNFIYASDPLRRLANRIVGFHPDRSMPLLPVTTVRAWYSNRKKTPGGRKRIHFFCDEFTDYLDVEIGKKAILLLEAMGYQVIIPVHLESGRSYLSKGLVKKAADIANTNIRLLCEVVSEECPLVGIEPSAVLTLRDEYADLAEPLWKEKALALAKNTYTIEEFIAGEHRKGAISKESFTKEKRLLVLHEHCYQKALSSRHSGYNMLSLPENYIVQVIPSGCCGMAGSFGYETEHFSVSQQIGELVLFPTIRKLLPDSIIVAPGTSCRHQIKDGTKRTALHPVEVLYDALLYPA